MRFFLFYFLLNHVLGRVIRLSVPLKAPGESRLIGIDELGKTNRGDHEVESELIETSFGGIR
jgi:hypothetical protein